jgi:hypothetical protein
VSLIVDICKDIGSLSLKYSVKDSESPSFEYSGNFCRKEYTIAPLYISTPATLFGNNFANIF